MAHHPYVDEVAVAGLPDEMTGEAIKAWVILKKEHRNDISSDDLKAWCLENMAKWKSPKYIEFVKLLPVSLTGKVQHRTLKEKDIEKMEKGRKIRG